MGFYCGVTWFRERSGVVETGRWIQIVGAFGKRLDATGSGSRLNRDLTGGHSPDPGAKGGDSGL